MSYENVPKNSAEKAVLIRQGAADYITLSTDPAPVPAVSEAGAVWEHSDTGNRYRWTSTNWVIEVTPIPEPAIKDWGFEVSTGRVANTESLTIVGRNPNVPNNSDFSTIWSGGGVYSGFNATVAEVVSIVSDSVNDTLVGTGANTVTIKGLDASYIEQSETINLNGTTPVVTTNSYMRVNSFVVATAGSSGHNEGTIIANQSVTTANVFGVINATDNTSLACIFTVPANCTASVISSYAGIANKASAVAEIKYMIRLIGKVFTIAKWVAVSSSGSSYVNRNLGVPLSALPAGTDIKVETSSGTASVAITAGIGMILEYSV